MRIAYVCADPGVPAFGEKGASIHVRELVRAFTALGAEVTLLARSPGADAQPAPRGVRLRWLGEVPRGEARARERALLESNAALPLLLAQEGPFDLVYERHALFSFAAMEWARDAGVPGILEVNAPLVEEQARHRELVDRDGAERARRRSFAAASRIVAVSSELAEHLKGLVDEPARIAVVANGVDPGRFPAETRAELPGDPRFKVGFVGTLRPWHDLGALADAFALLERRAPGNLLVVVGDGPLRETLERRLDVLGVRGATHFAGRVAPERVPAWLAALDVAVAPYAPADPFYFSPLKLFEYMAARLPVVASRIGQQADLLAHGRNALLVEPGDAAGLAAALLCLRGDAKLRSALGLAARASVERSHSWRTVALRILGLARGAVGPERLPGGLAP